MKNNKSMHNARINKNDEWYTPLNAIEEEISMHMDYVRQFEGKTVLCNCDDPEWSNFFLFFRLHFKQLKLKKVIFTHYEPDGKPSYKLEWSGDYLGYDTLNLIKTPLEGNGDFRSPECVALLDECDIVVTNPPFSLFREYVGLLLEHKKDFVIIGNKNSITMKEIFPKFQDGTLSLGYTVPQNFTTPTGEVTKQVNGLCVWYTTLKLDKYNEELPLCAQYEGHEDQYPKYDNYDAIEVNKTSKIPRDYWGVMGVYAATFFSNWNKEQFEIVGVSDAESPLKTKMYSDWIGYKEDGTKTGRTGSTLGSTPVIVKERGKGVYYEKNGIRIYGTNARVFIRRLK